MTVYARDYAKDHGDEPSGKFSWAYMFTFNKVRHRKTGFQTKKAAEFAEQKARKELVFDGKQMSAVGSKPATDGHFKTSQLIRPV